MPTRKAPAGHIPDLPPGCTLRKARPGEEDAIAAVLINAFDGIWPRRTISVPPAEHLRWKFSGDPIAIGEHFVVERDARIIAVRPVWCDRVKIGDRIVLARSSVDRAVLPEFQRMGIMTAIDAHIPAVWLDQFDAILGISNTWQSIRYVPGQPYRRKLDIVSRPLEGALPEVTTAGWIVRAAPSFDERIDQLWREASPAFDFALVRTARRLNYRYADRRAGDYTIAIAEQAGQVLGYLVYSSWKDVGQIVDALVLPGRADVLESLIAFSLRQLQALANSTAECWRDLHHPYGLALDRLGFATRLRSHKIALHIPNSEGAAAFFAVPGSAVHFMAGDTDLA